MSVMGALVDGFLSRVWVAMVGMKEISKCQIEADVVERTMKEIVVEDDVKLLRKQECLGPKQ